jgi:hypothetical protein
MLPGYGMAGSISKIRYRRAGKRAVSASADLIAVLVLDRAANL